jgi:hypothetical protein
VGVYRLEKNVQVSVLWRQLFVGHVG